MKQLKDFTLRLIAGANIMNIIVMLAVGYSGGVNPASHHFIGIVGLSFPIFMAINMAFLVFWLCVRKRWALIPFVGFVLCYGPVRAYLPLNVYKPVPNDCIKVLAYNILSWGEMKPDNPDLSIIDYIVRTDADIVSLEEASATSWVREKIDSALAQRYPHQDTVLSADKTDDIWLMSKYPIVRKQRIDYETKTNHSAAFWLKRGNDTIIVVANHLQSTSLSMAERSQFRSFMYGDINHETTRTESQTLYRKLGKATSERSYQIDYLVRFVEAHKHTPLIMCGDFNDSPISYSRQRMASVLNDCYVESGNGPGISYHRNAFYVRIDHIFCSDHFLPYDCKVDNSISTSDHYPIVCWLKLRK